MTRDQSKIPMDPNTEHITPLLIALFTNRGDLAPADVERILAHIHMCQECQTAFSMLLMAELGREDLPNDEREMAGGLLEQATRLLHEPTIESDSELYAAYAEAAVASGPQEARHRFPLVAAHVDRCKACQAEVDELISALSEAVTLGVIEPFTSLYSTNPAAESPTADASLWEKVMGDAYRLRERLTVAVGRATVTVSSALESLQPSMLRAGEPALEARDSVRDVRDATLGREERLVFNLPVRRPPGDAATDRATWIRIKLDLRALYDRQVVANISATEHLSIAHVPPDVDDQGKPWVGLSWRAELLDDGIRRVCGRGATDDVGVASFTMPQGGAYELSFVVGDDSWTIPFDVRH